MDLAALRTQYINKVAEYDSIVNSAVASNDTTKIARIRQLNQEISAILDQMLQKIAETKQSTPVLVSERDELVKKLRRIQFDYNGLLVNTDALETLRRIREQESGSNSKALTRYLFFFFVICLLVMLAMLFFKKGSYSSITTSAPTPNMTPAFI
jgi:hypothetical protein